jgi:hypothetical protein
VRILPFPIKSLNYYRRLPARFRRHHFAKLKSRGTVTKFVARQGAARRRLPISSEDPMRLLPKFAAFAQAKHEKQ